MKKTERKWQNVVESIILHRDATTFLFCQKKSTLPLVNYKLSYFCFLPLFSMMKWMNVCCLYTVQFRMHDVFAVWCRNLYGGGGKVIKWMSISWEAGEEFSVSVPVSSVVSKSVCGLEKRVVKTSFNQRFTFPPTDGATIYLDGINTTQPIIAHLCSHDDDVVCKQAMPWTSSHVIRAWCHCAGCRLFLSVFVCFLKLFSSSCDKFLSDSRSDVWK